MSEKFTLGARLRKLRKERSLSQRDLASQAGLSANAISLIERNEISPSVSTVHRLASTLNVKMSYFFERDEPPTNLIFLKADECPSLSGKGLTVTGVGQRLHNQEVELFVITLAPGGGSGPDPVIHAGQEFVYCLQGVLEYKVDGEAYHLEPGDVLLFEAELPHHWRNPASEGETRFLVVLQISEGATDPIRRHFSEYPSLSHMG